MGKTKRLRLAAKLRQAPLSEQLTDSSGVKKRVKKKREDKPTENDEQVYPLIRKHVYMYTRVTLGDW